MVRRTKEKNLLSLWQRANKIPNHRIHKQYNSTRGLLGRKRGRKLSHKSFHRYKAKYVIRRGIRNL